MNTDTRNALDDLLLQTMGWARSNRNDWIKLIKNEPGERSFVRIMHPVYADDPDELDPQRREKDWVLCILTWIGEGEWKPGDPWIVEPRASDPSPLILANWYEQQKDKLVGTTH